MLIYRMLVERTSYNYSEEAINRHYLKLVSSAGWLTKKHMCATCFRPHLQTVVSDTNGGREKTSLGNPVITDIGYTYETGSSRRIAIQKHLKQKNLHWAYVWIAAEPTVF